MKLVVTSQQRLQQIVSQSGSTSASSQTKQHISDYTRDVYLSPLSDDDSLKFIDSSLVSLLWDKQDWLNHNLSYYILIHGISKHFLFRSWYDNLSQVRDLFTK